MRSLTYLNIIYNSFIVYLKEIPKLFNPTHVHVLSYQSLLTFCERSLTVVSLSLSSAVPFLGLSLYQFGCPPFPPPLTFLSIWPLLGGHSRSNSGSSESSLPNLARSLLLVDQLIDI